MLMKEGKGNKGQMNEGHVVLEPLGVCVDHTPISVDLLRRKLHRAYRFAGPAPPE
jgi:hypothetical protein